MGEPRPEEDMVSALREAMERSAVITGSMVAKLDSMGNSASVIDAEIRPLQMTLRDFNVANENIDRTIEVVEDILLQFDIARRAQATISKGPNQDLKRYVEAMGQLRGIIDFFSSNNTKIKSSDELLNRVKKLLTKAAPVIEEEFRQLMGTYSKPVEPDRLFDCLPKLICMSSGAPEAVEEQPPQSSELSWNPTLIPPSILQLLHDMAHHLVQDGNHQSCYQIYRLFVDRRPMNIDSK